MASGNPFDRSLTSRQRRRKRKRSGGGLTDPVAPPAPEEGALVDTPFDPETMTNNVSLSGSFMDPSQGYGQDSSWLDTGEGSAAFNDPEFRNQAVWGMLNQAGVSKGGPGALGQERWLDSEVENLIGEYEGLTMNQAPDLSLENFMYGAFGQAAPGEGAVEGAVGTDESTVAGDPLGRRDWLRQEQNIGGNDWRDLNKNRRERLRKKYGIYVDNFGAESGDGGTPDPNTPGLEDWRQSQFYPAMRAELRRRWALTSPFERGTDMSRWGGPSSTVAF